MAIQHPLVVYPFTAEADTPKYSLVKLGATEGGAAVATAATDALIGTTLNVDALNGTVMDVCTEGSPYVTYGGTIAYKDPVTSDAQGRAVKAATGNLVIGIAMQAGVVGDVGVILLKKPATAAA